MKSNYIFQTQRLGFRNWEDHDIDKMAAINANKEVMKFFPNTYSKKETQQFIEKMQKQFKEKDFCYFAVDKLMDGELIGFIGLSEQTYDVDFTPCVDIGWRLDKKEWNKGFATEGAKKCLEYAKTNLGLDKIMAIAPVINTNSIAVMQKIGMYKVKIFNHPLLRNNEKLKQCVLYQKDFIK